MNDSSAKNLCGFNDWRVPTSQELISIVDNSVTGPSIDSSYFPNTNSWYFWTASPSAYYPSGALCINFFDGSICNNWRGGEIEHVRLVRSGQ
ncbi:MAG TPA: DUF1566 domain-containing protein [Gammaproteobacteria bacterium]|nr:DUF1566 domain-containing protein [Xanthomonadales bacterium]HPI97028.1 DUF1566 domain-containing protein [Gammaproteobacteria bacterium]